MSEISKSKAFIFSILLLATTIVLCFFVGELILTMQHDNMIKRIDSENGERLLCTTRSEHPELIYTRIPNKCATNSQGFRDFDHVYSKAEETFRIVIIGDSVAEGQGVPLEDTFGKVLEKYFNETQQGNARKVEVIVLAQSGYSTVQELFLLEKEAIRYSPDLIVWSYVLNDPAHPVYHNASGDLALYYFKPESHLVHFIFSKLFLIAENVKRRAYDCDYEYHKLLHCVYWQQVETNIKTLANISAKNGIPVVFLIHPVFKENGDYNSYPLSSLHENIGAVASISGLSVLDLQNAYRPYKPDELTQSTTPTYDAWHPNGKGHKIVGDALFEHISSSKYMDGRFEKKD